MHTHVARKNPAGYEDHVCSQRQRLIISSQGQVNYMYICRCGLSEMRNCQNYYPVRDTNAQHGYNNVYGHVSLCVM